MRRKMLLIPGFLMLILPSSSLSNNDDLQVSDLETEMHRLFRPEKWIHHFKDSLEETTNCYKSLLPMVLPENPKSKPDWVYRMLDAAGKFGLNGGLFDGNLVAYGSFEECIQIEVNETILQVTLPDLPTYNVTQPAFTGQYVLNTLVLNMSSANSKGLLNLRHGDYGTDFNTSNSLIRDILFATALGGGQIGHIGLCVPSTCNAQGLQEAMNRLLKSTLGDSVIDVIDNFHYTKARRSFSAGDIVAIIVLVLIGGLALVGTAIDALTHADDPKRRSIAVKLLLCFSLKTNGGKLLSTQKSEGNIDCINGIRFLSMAWVVLGHTFYGSTLVPMENVFSYGDVFGIWSMQMVSAATQSVDTFFLLSGFLMSYLTLKDFERRRFVNLSLPFYSYLHRYIRLTPAYGLIMLILSTLMLHLGTGPLWAKMEQQSEACAQQWWKNLLYINNFFDPKPTCMGESWYLACDFQLFLLGPWIMILIWKVKRFAKFIMAALLVISCTIPGLLTGLNHWPPQNFATILFGDWMSGFYTQFYTRSTPYIWGIIFGCIVFNHKSTAKEAEKSLLEKILIASAWLISTIVGLTTVFGLYSYWPIDFTCVGNSNCFSMTAAVMWASFGRLAWSLVVSWVIFACINGYDGGVINGFLSWKLFAPLSRLTYTIYLIHMHIIFLYHFGADNPLHFERYSMVYNFFGHLTVSTLCALAASLLFEAPFIGLEKLAFGRKERREKPKQTAGMSNNGVKLDQ